jgi:hypothetical protein
MKARYIMLIAGLLVAGAAQADVLKCLDKDGNIIFTDTPSRDCVEPADQKKADPQDETRTDTSVSAEEIQRRAAEAKRAEQDRNLLLTYQSVAEIEAVRDRRIEQIEARNFVTQRYVERLNQQLEDLEAAAAEYTAAGSESGTPGEVPVDLQEDIQSTQASIDDYGQRLAAGRAEQDRIREEFAEDISRFQELKGITSDN